MKTLLLGIALLSLPSLVLAEEAVVRKDTVLVNSSGTHFIRTGTTVEILRREGTKLVVAHVGRLTGAMPSDALDIPSREQTGPQTFAVPPIAEPKPAAPKPVVPPPVVGTPGA